MTEADPILLTSTEKQSGKS